MASYRWMLQHALLRRQAERRTLRGKYAAADTIVNALYIAAWALVVIYCCGR